MKNKAVDSHAVAAAGTFSVNVNLARVLRPCLRHVFDMEVAPTTSSGAGPRLRARCVVMALAASIGSLTSLAHAADGSAPAGKVFGQLRYRYELVDQEGIASKAKASTLRTQLGYDTENYRGFGALLQFEDVHAIGRERYNSTVNGATQYPVVADPESTEINQAYLRYVGLPATTLRVGRQAITYDNHRFVGDVGWRQNQQTYDAATLVNTAIADTTFSYAHVTNVNRIFGENHPTLSDVEIRGDFLNVAYKGMPAGTLVGYGYFIDFEPGQPFATTASNKTLGLRFDGATTAAGRKWLYTAEYAKQSDYADGSGTVDADYLSAVFGVDLAGVQLKLGYELLSGDGTYALQTPFATLHAHNGWADKFLVTPTDGLVDTTASIGGSVAGVNLLAVYHDYTSDNLDYAYGKELNLLAAWKLTKQLTLLAKYADYRGDDNGTNLARNSLLARDITKTWLQADYLF